MPKPEFCPFCGNDHPALITKWIEPELTPLPVTWLPVTWYCEICSERWTPKVEKEAETR